MIPPVRSMSTFLKNIIFFVPSLICCPASFAQTKAEQIKSIRSEYAIINRSTTLKKVTLKNEEFLPDMTDGGGELTGFYNHGKIKKIIQWTGLSNGIDTREYYFKEDQLIFVFVKFSSFVYGKKKNQPGFSKTEATFRGRYYFHNKKLIDFATTGRYPPGSTNPATALLEEASDNFKLLNKKIVQNSGKQLIRGHWVSLDDNRSHVVFSDSVMTDLYNNKVVGTSGYWFGETDTLFTKDKNAGDTLTYGILSVTRTHLTLMYLSRGNLLRFKRK